MLVAGEETPCSGEENQSGGDADDPAEPSQASEQSDATARDVGDQ